MSHPIDLPTKEFITVLDKTQKLLIMIESIRECSGKIAPDPLPDSDFMRHAVSVFNNAKENNQNLVILSGTLLLHLAGQFEQYIQDCMKTVAEDYANKCAKFEELPSAMQSNIINWTAEIILHPTKYNYEQDKVKTLVNQLSATISSSACPVEVNSDCLVITEQNMRPDTLTGLVKRFEIKDVWKEIAKQSSIKTYLGIESETDIEKRMKEILNNLMEDRNQVAHPSSIPSYPDNQKLQDYIEYLREFSKVFTELLIQKCKVFKPITTNATIAAPAPAPATVVAP